MSSDAIETFVARARDYCALIDSVDALGTGEFVWRVFDRLVALYVAGALLPEIDAPISDSTTAVESTLELSERLQRKLGARHAYLRVYDPFDSKEVPFEASLAGDLADVYADIHEGLTALSNGVPEAEVVWEWRWSFGHHWGIHAAAALYAIHWMTHTAGEEWIDPDEP
jgi:hypothetical protein